MEVRPCATNRIRSSSPVKVKRRIPWQLALLPLTIVSLCAHSPRDVSIHTKDSLSLRQGSYSSVFFFAEPLNREDNNLPVQYQFAGSGTPPPGMIFEVYPCNKPNKPACPQVAASNGIFLDGTPKEAGSYTLLITATDGDGRKSSQEFTVTVDSPDHAK